jgi:predicted Zn-dependent protease with MMP-like domain
MTWSDAQAPSLDELDALARQCLASLPTEFRRLCEGIAMRIADFPSDEVLREMGIESPFDLTGLYQGIDLTQKSVAEVAPMPDMIFLYRRPILDEWAEGGVTLRELITHILVHEIGHHFGLSDEAMHEIERRASEGE